MVTTGQSNVSIITGTATVDAANLTHSEWIELINLGAATLTLEGASSLTTLKEILSQQRLGAICSIDSAIASKVEAADNTYLAPLCLLRELPDYHEWRSDDGLYESEKEIFLALRRSRDRKPYFVEYTVVWALTTASGTLGGTTRRLTAQQVEVNKGEAVLGRVLSEGHPDRLAWIGGQVLQHLFMIQAKAASALRSKAQHADASKRKLQRFLTRISKST